MVSVVYYPLVALAGYLLGAVPFGWIAGRLVKGIDIRQYGSGRVGATNTLRTLGWQISIFVFTADLLKGLAPVLVVRSFLHDPLAESVVALAAMLGHCWSPYIGFYGGRGVTTSLGGLFAFHPLAAATGLAVTGIPVGLTRLVSLGSLLGTTTSLVIVLVLAYLQQLPTALLVFTIGAAGVIFFQHRDNLGRLLKGSERRLGEQATKVKNPSQS